MGGCLILALPFTYAQEFSFRNYRVEAGLPSDIVKATTQDSLGYFWIATDEGLAKYDGIRFTRYPNATHSNYTKGFLTTRNGRLLAFGDLDLVEIKNLGDTVLFQPVCKVAQIESDSSLLYPKLIFEDRHGSLWVAESQAVVRLGSKSLKRYSFDLSNRSPQFLRSFSFFEDKKGNLFVSSYQGNVFRYDSRTDSFIPVTSKFPASVEFVSTQDNLLIVGCLQGVFTAKLGNEGGFQDLELRMKIPMVSYVAQNRDGQVLIGTRGNQHFVYNIEDGTLKLIPHNINNINHIYISKEKDVWFSGNEGLVRMQEDLFRGTNDGIMDFIESIAEDSVNNTIYYATSQTLYSYNTISRKTRVLLNKPGGYFQSLVLTQQGLWVANAFTVFLFAEGKIKKQFDFTIGGRFITKLTVDTHGDIWLTIPGTQDAVVIDPALNLRRYKVKLERDAIINSIRQGKEDMYIASAGENSYLYFKSNSDSVFQNISIPLPFKGATDFNAHDLVVWGKNIWLATSKGLMKFDGKTVEKVKVRDRFVNLSVKSVLRYSGNKLLISTAYGMIMYDIITGFHDLFNESAGLPSNTLSNQGIFIGAKKTVWLGTAKGLCFGTRPLTQLITTLPPHFISVQANGKQTTLGKKIIPYGSFLTIDVSSISFPEDEMNYQYRFKADDPWSNSTTYELRFSTLPAGKYKLEVRAKKNGSYVWSNSSLLNFTVGQPFWQHWQFYGMCFFIAIMLLSGTFVILTARNQRKNRNLRALVNQRTIELQKSNEELVQLNIEKNNLIGIVAHDLKSPLKQILGLLDLIRHTKKADKELSDYLTYMERSASKLDGMIYKILDVEAIESKQLNLSLERVDVSEILNAIGERYEQQAAKKNIVIKREIDPATFTIADKNYLDQVLENLVSNAIKFSPLGRNVFLTVSNRGSKVVCEIRDEGPGLSDNDKKMLFARFQKLSAKPTGEEISTGLGLSIVKKYVDAMGGSIWCVSEIGKGASFSVSFPRPLTSA